MTRLGLLAGVLALASSLTPAPAQALTGELTPIVFVHGQQGSAQQWQSNAKRFSSNGYADRLLYAYEYDTSIPSNDKAVAGLDGFVADVLARTNASSVDIIAHSRGTSVMHAFLATPARASLVRRYVNVDGRSSATPPGGVPTLALWGSLQPNGSIGGATNVYLTSLGHTETTTSAEGFVPMFRFLRGRSPFTARVLPEPPGLVRIAGRASYFPQNEGAEGLLEVWELDARTGARRGDPRHSVRTGPDGAFGPLHVNGRKHYELVLRRDGQPTYHYYFEPFERSDRFLRLQVSRRGGIADHVDRCAGHTAFTVVRNREWWADRPDAADNDHLLFNGVDVLAPAVAPRGRQVIAAFVFDDNCDRVSVPGVALSPFNGLPFLTGVDTYLPAQPDAGRPIRVTQTVRGTGGQSRTIAVPNWPSDKHSVTVQFKDYVDGAYTGARSM
ncbi:alpha/beta hydrolase [Kibdelosporangium persicum]|uniref:Extracellular esterase EstB n=1 Tax=Kibdelosporangium persicum TaxID=2698649 RepID=A0ABX2FHR8_9PSEU|nr:alpha/beta hydrolase [Kibdelosporangium persicum]NRN70773.1 Extracellular esterase EstB [Kibdelosporangium persicum]